MGAPAGQEAPLGAGAWAMICLISCPGLRRSRAEWIQAQRAEWSQGLGPLFHLLPGFLALYLLCEILRACSSFPGIQTFLEALEGQHVLDLTKPLYVGPQSSQTYTSWCLRPPRAPWQPRLSQLPSLPHPPSRVQPWMCLAFSCLSLHTWGCPFFLSTPFLNASC